MDYDSWHGNWGFFCMNVVHSDHHGGWHQGSVLYPITRVAFYDFTRIICTTRCLGSRPGPEVIMLAFSQTLARVQYRACKCDPDSDGAC